MIGGLPLVPLGEVLMERREIPSSEAIMAGDVRIVAKISFNDGQIELREGSTTKTGMILIHPRDLVVSGINAAKGAIAVYGEENTKPIAATIHYASYVVNGSRGYARYLWWLLRSNTFRHLLAQHAPGGVKTELRSKHLLRVPVPLPGADEQRRIVARIEALAAKIEEARRLRRGAAVEAALLRSRTFSTILDTLPQERAPLERYLAKPMLNGLSLPADSMGSGTLFAKVGIVNSGVFNPLETKLCAVELPQDSPYWLTPGDVLVSRGNTQDLVGRAAVYEGDPPGCAMPDLLIRLRLNPALVDPRFIVQYFHSSEARAFIESRVTGTSSSMKKISQPKLAEMPIPVLPVAEQRRVVAYLDDLQARVDTLKHLQAETAAELEALLPAVLDKAFKGEL